MKKNNFSAMFTEQRKTYRQKVTREAAVFNDSFIRELLAFDREAWVIFRSQYLPLISHVARGHRNIDVEDLFQELSARLVANNCQLLRRFRYGGEDGFVSWICTIAKKIIYEMLRAEKRQKKLFEQLRLDWCQNSGMRHDPAKICSDKLLYEQFCRAWQELPEERRRVVELSLDGYTHREIAVILGIKQNTSLSHYSRAICYLQQRVGWYG